MNDDAARLREFAATGSQDAFAAIVQRYVPLVYRAALRRTGGDAHRAEDVAQLVFIVVAREAAKLATHPDLTGWMFTTTRFLAAKTVRSERRRAAREHVIGVGAHTMADDPPPEPAAPLNAMLDDVMMELKQVDRQIILLRFHHGLRLAEIGAQLGATENAIQKRVDRALDLLKDRFARRGITSSAAALALALEQQASVAMPAGLVAAATSAGLAGGAGAGALLAGTGFMMVSKLQLGAAALVVAGLSASLVWQAHESIQLRAALAGGEATAAEAAQLRQKIAALTQRADAAGKDAAALQKALDTARPAPPRRVLTDSRQQMNETMKRISQLGAEHRWQEALEVAVEFYRSVAGRNGLSMEQQMMMRTIEKLAHDYPPALTALRDLRDTAMQKVQANAGADSRQLLIEIGNLNECLGEGRATMALYDTLPAGDSSRQALAVIAQSSFIEARRYADAYVGKSYGNMLREVEMGTTTLSHQDHQNQVGVRTMVVQGLLSDIEVLTGIGKTEEARALTEKLVALDNSEATRAALQQRVARAGASVPSSP